MLAKENDWKMGLRKISPSVKRKLQENLGKEI